MAALRKNSPHLTAALVACGMFAAILLGGRALAIYLEDKTIAETAPQDFFIKNQGLAFQRAAAQRDDVLLLYGSSELTNKVPNRPQEYFAGAPTGFQVCPIGRPGFTSLVMLQRIAALANNVRDRKIAISISPSFFFRHEIDASAYAGNFSLPAANGALFGGTLDWPLKHDLARRMREFPDTLAKSTLLRLAVNGIAADDSLGRFVFAAVSPLGKLENAIYDLQDHFEALVYLAANGRKISRQQLRALLHEEPAEPKLPKTRLHGVHSIARHGDADFRDRINAADEWIDIELLFRTLKRLNAHAFVVSLPFNGAEYDGAGVTRAARQVYYDRLRNLAQRYQLQFENFEDHDSDLSFQQFHSEHPTAEGWKYIDDALDKFFHEPDRYAWHQ